MTRTPDVTPLLPDDGTLRARARALGDEIAPRRRRRARTLGLAVAAALLVGGGVATASGLLGADDVAVDAGIGCYDRAALDANTTVTGPRRDPVAACAKLWRDGAVRAGERSAPTLVACTGKDEPVRVFPAAGPAVCAELDLEPLPDDYAGAAEASARALRALRALEDELSVASTPCPSPPALARSARARVDVAVTIRGTGPCASGYGVDRDHVTVNTVSREDAAVNHMYVRITRALRPAFGSTDSCRPPEGAVAEARRLLAAAGLQDVRVVVEGDGPCIGGGNGIDAAERMVTLLTTSRAEAAKNAAGNERSAGGG